MRKSHVVEILARRLVKPPGRVEEILKSLQMAGLVSIEKGSRRFPAEASEDDIIALVMAAICDVGATQNAAHVVAEYGALTCETGATFRQALAAVLFGGACHVGHVISATPPGISTVINDRHIVFGATPKGAAAIASGDAVMAIAAEIQGASPADTDVLMAISKLRRAAIA